MNKKIWYRLIHSILAAGILMLFSGCCTIIGGAKYQAHITAVGHPNATIYLNGVIVGTGNAIVKVKRNMADQLNITIKDDDCDYYEQTFTKKAIRPFFTFVAISDGVELIAAALLRGVLYIPIFTIIDGLVESYYKPDAEKDLRITKIDYDNFRYYIEYPNCKETEIIVYDHIDTSYSSSDKEALTNEANTEKIYDLMILNTYLNKINVLVDSSIGIVINNLQISEEDKSMEDYYHRIAEILNKSGISDANYIKTSYSDGIIREVGIKIPVLDEKKREKMVKIGVWHIFNEKGKVSGIQIYNIKGNKEGVWTIFNDDGNKILETIYVDGIQISENIYGN